MVYKYIFLFFMFFLLSSCGSFFEPSDVLSRVRTTQTEKPPSSDNDYLSANIGILKYVPSGAFQRDSTNSDISFVSAFRMSAFDITRIEFTSITGLPDPSDTGSSTGINDPVQMVSWYQAVYFCNMLSMKEGLTPIYTINNSTDPADWLSVNGGMIPTNINVLWQSISADWSADGYRLPTEMEWTWADMGADTSAPGQLNTIGYLKAFAGSTGNNCLLGYAWIEDNSSGTTHPVGTKLPNELGLYDMSGNVNQWLWDWYRDIPGGALTNYSEAGASGLRVYRGGCWDYPSESATISRYYLDYNIPYLSFNDVGFRVVRH